MPKFQINRRGFLLGLMALGASTSLSTPIEAATPAQIDKVWKELGKNPWFFDTNDRTILDTDFKEPELWSDVFDNVTSHHVRPDSLVSEVERYQPLTHHFQNLAADELWDVEQALREDGLSEPAFASKRQALVRLRDVLSEPYYGWQEWIMLEGPMNLDRFNQAIQDWLDAPVNHTQSEFFPIDYGVQGGPYRFFSMMDPDVRDELGVVVVEGEHPGSTYYAAELRKPVDEANATAEALGLPFRFR